MLPSCSVCFSHASLTGNSDFHSSRGLSGGYLAGSDGCGRSNSKRWKVLLPLELARVDILALGGTDMTRSTCHLFAHYLGVFAVPPVSHRHILLSAGTIRHTWRKGLFWFIGCRDAENPLQGWRPGPGRPVH